VLRRRADGQSKELVFGGCFAGNNGTAFEPDQVTTIMFWWISTFSRIVDSSLLVQSAFSPISF
jgi:hypothetical protein